MTSQFDVIIIGSGIVGLATAYRLAQLNGNRKILIIEKENEICKHQSGNNSGVIHSGIYYKPGSLRAENCIRGYRQLLEFCNEHGIDYELCGKLIVATKEDEISQLDKIFDRGLANGLKGIKKISGDEARSIEPYVNAVAAIHVPEAGIIHYPDVASKMLELYKEKGGEIVFGYPVENIEIQAGKVLVETTRNSFTTKLLINCAGLYSDKVAKMTGQKLDFMILPFRGEYYQLKKESEFLVNHLIYPVPNPSFPFLGVHFTRMLKGGIEAGPNAVFAFKREGYSRWDLDVFELWEAINFKGFQKLVRKYWELELDELIRSFSKIAFVNALKKLIPDIGFNDVERGGAGVRAMACSSEGELMDDYIIIEGPGVIHVCNAPSPAATSSLSIGQTIADLVIKRF